MRQGCPQYIKTQMSCSNCPLVQCELVPSVRWCDLAKTASLRWVLHCFTLPTAVLCLVGFLAVPGLLQRSLPSLSHSSTLIKYCDLTTLISEISDFIDIAICSSYPCIYVYCGGCQPYVQSHVAFMACQIINFLDLLLSFSQQVIAWGYFVPDPQLIQLIITVPLLPAELCPLGTWQAMPRLWGYHYLPAPALQWHKMAPSRCEHICNKDMGRGAKKKSKWGFEPSLE